MIFELDEKEIKHRLKNVTQTDIEKSLNKNSNYNIYDYINLISEPAEKYIEILAQKSHKITLQRFGKTIKLYTPIYVSNICINNCVYCGFNKNNKIKRTTLTFYEIEQECKKIKELGFDNILLLTGSAPKITDINYLKKSVQILQKYFSYIGIEIFPLTYEQYKIMVDTGVDSLTLYQETYNRDLYKKLHLSGPKRNYDFRLEGPERAAKANIKDIGLGVLLGLYDWRIDTAFMVQHAYYLIKKFWKTKINFSFPRIQPASGGFKPLSKVTDKNMVQLISVLRIMFNDSELLLSTRENKNIRNNFLNIGITQISAGSKTNPGGYSNIKKSDNQFDISDKRSVEEIISFLKKRGFDPIIKNWDNKYKQYIG